MKKILLLLLIVFMGIGLYAHTVEDLARGSNLLNSDVSSSSTSIWELCHYVDEFNRPTESKYINTVALGTYDNLYSSDIELGVVLFLDKNWIRFDIYEYGMVSPTFTEGDKISGKLLIGNEVILLENLKPTTNGDLCLLTEKDLKPIINALANNTDVLVYIESITEYFDYKTTYLFEIKADGFLYAFKELLSE